MIEKSRRRRARGAGGGGTTEKGAGGAASAAEGGACRRSRSRIKRSRRSAGIKATELSEAGGEKLRTKRIAMKNRR